MTGTTRVAVFYANRVEAGVPLWPADNVLFRCRQDELAVTPDTAVVQQNLASTYGRGGESRSPLVKNWTKQSPRKGGGVDARLKPRENAGGSLSGARFRHRKNNFHFTPKSTATIAAVT